MMRCTHRLANVAAFYEFVDSNFLNNKRPPIPGGSWPVENLRLKSLADLQQIWFQLLKEKNMLSSTKEHYLKHQEELGAMPAPSRLKMVEESMDAVKQVVRERDAEATQQATDLFKERLRRGVYRYPPGPPPPPGAHDPTSVIQVTLSRRIEPERLRELLGRYDVLEAHKGIVKIELRLPAEVLAKKEEAEQLWTQYVAERSDIEEYYKWATPGATCNGEETGSVYDYVDVELAPGVFANDMKEVVKAAEVPVPAPATRPPPPKNPLEHIKYERRSTLSKSVIQLGYFPNITLPVPRYSSAEEAPRPVHPDEIEGPWVAVITYDSKGALDYVRGLGLTSLDGAEVLAFDELSAAENPAQPYAAVDPAYQEAVRAEMAQEETQMQWPHVPEWKYEYDLYTKKHLSEIVQYNYSNVVDYIDREVLLTGRSVWECPVDIDPTCGSTKSVPAHAKKPVKYMTRTISDVGATDI